MTPVSLWEPEVARTPSTTSLLGSSEAVERRRFLPLHLFDDVVRSVRRHGEVYSPELNVAQISNTSDVVEPGGIIIVLNPKLWMTSTIAGSSRATVNTLGQL